MFDSYSVKYQRERQRVTVTARQGQQTSCSIANISLFVFLPECQKVWCLCNKLSCPHKTDGHYWSSVNSLAEAKCLICCWDGSLLTSALRRLSLHCASQAMQWHSHLSTGRALRMALTVTTWQNDRPSLLAPISPTDHGVCWTIKWNRALDHPGDVSTDRVGDLSSVPLMRLKLSGDGLTISVLDLFRSTHHPSHLEGWVQKWIHVWINMESLCLYFMPSIIKCQILLKCKMQGISKPCHLSLKY